mmetsp:Transcript_102334/g.270806  ORF Transcript_102334/g.270806 Transcript_102334/m.270806 type:complete len:107 (+) Transcript_102334:813-1133(+)
MQHSWISGGKLQACPGGPGQKPEVSTETRSSMPPAAAEAAAAAAAAKAAPAEGRRLHAAQALRDTGRHEGMARLIAMHVCTGSRLRLQLRADQVQQAARLWQGRNT